MKSFVEEKAALARAGCRKGNSTFYVSNPTTPELSNKNQRPKSVVESHSFLQYALLYFRDTDERYQRFSKNVGNSLAGTIRILDYLKVKRAKKDPESSWTWKAITDLVKYTPFPVVNSLLKLETDHHNRLAVNTFRAIMTYMGDLPSSGEQKSTECIYTILVITHHHPELRDEVFCQLMKQTTSNKSPNKESSILGWRLMAFLTAFFKCSDTLMPYFKKYLETAAHDHRREEQGMAETCLHNLQQTVRYGGRRNVPCEEELEAVTRGEMSISQAYFLPGGVQQHIQTTTTTVVKDITQRICHRMGIHEEPEFSEFSLYCIVEGDLYTMPLESDEYILDLVAELKRNKNTFYLIFCRSVWHFPLRLDSELYIEIIFHQVTPDYLEGYLLVLPSRGSNFPETAITEIARIAALIHRSAGMNSSPTETDVMYLLPKPVLNLKQLTEKEWTEKVFSHWKDMVALEEAEAKAQCLELLQKWPLFGSCFFGIKMINKNEDEEDFILAVNKNGINVLDVETHETLWRFSFSCVHQINMTIECEDTTFSDLELGDEVVKKRIRLQVDHAHEVLRLIQQYSATQHHPTISNTEETNYPKVMIKV